MKTLEILEFFFIRTIFFIWPIVNELKMLEKLKKIGFFQKIAQKIDFFDFFKQILDIS